VRTDPGTVALTFNLKDIRASQQPVYHPERLGGRWHADRMSSSICLEPSTTIRPSWSPTFTGYLKDISTPGIQTGDDKLDLHCHAATDNMSASNRTRDVRVYSRLMRLGCRIGYHQSDRVQRQWFVSQDDRHHWNTGHHRNAETGAAKYWTLVGRLTLMLAETLARHRPIN
jgi:hypothetical protein